jgi:hypothetical protein
MTGNEIRDARVTLGELYRLGRPLHAVELARLLGLPGRDPGRTIRAYELDKYPVPGPISVAIEMMCAGATPPTFDQVFNGAATRPKRRTTP